MLTAVQTVALAVDVWAWSGHAQLSTGYARLLQADLRDGKNDGLTVPCFQGERLDSLDTRA